MSDAKLLPCPFCGGEVVLGGMTGKPVCHDYCMDNADVRPDIETWNRREYTRAVALRAVRMAAAAWAGEIDDLDDEAIVTRAMEGE